MEKIEFQKIMEALEKRIEHCSAQLSEVTTTDDLSRLTITEAADLKSFCVAEEEVMTKIVMVDLYHIIGMGELTPPQMMKFTYAMQKYQQYRPTIKAITKWSGDILDLPKIPVVTQYKLMGLGDITLYAGVGEYMIDVASVEDYSQTKRKPLLPFKIEGRRIKVDMTQFDFFVTLMTNLTKSPLNTDNFAKALAAHKDYLGIEWIGCNSYEAIGCFKSDDMYKKLSSYYSGQS